MSKVSMRTRVRRSRRAKERQQRTRTRFLLTKLRDQVNSGEVDPELQKELNVHFGTLWKFRMKS